MATINSVNTSPSQYAVQVGGVNGTTANVAPSATAGIPVISGGSAANPSFGTAVVAGGGTGIVAAGAAYAPICAGTTTTGAFQTASTGIATSGFILTSNGAAAVPSFQAPAASSISITGTTGGALTGAAFVFSGGTTGLTFAGSTGPNTETLGGTLVVAHGGTGAATLTGVLTGNGTSAVTANAITQHAVLIAGAANAVSNLGVATNGQLIIGSTGADPVLATLTSTSGTISITNGAGSINLEVATAAFGWTDVTGGSASMAVNNGYLADSGSLTTLTMPTSAVIGDSVRVVGVGAGGWTIDYGTGQFIKFGTVATTTDTGSLSSTNENDSLELICTTPSLTAPIFTVVASVGNISYVQTLTVVED